MAHAWILVDQPNFHLRAFWPGWITSTRRCELGFGGAYARSRVWFSRQGTRRLLLSSHSGGVFDFDAARRPPSVSGVRAASRRTRRQSQRPHRSRRVLWYTFRKETSD